MLSSALQSSSTDRTGILQDFGKHAYLKIESTYEFTYLHKNDSKKVETANFPQSKCIKHLQSSLKHTLYFIDLIPELLWFLWGYYFLLRSRKPRVSQQGFKALAGWLLSSVSRLYANQLLAQASIFSIQT